MSRGEERVDDGQAERVFRLLIGVYLGGGLINAMVNLLVPRLRLTLGLNYHQALTVQLAYYSTYLLFAAPVALWTVRMGFLRAITGGLLVMGTGCILLSLANATGGYPSVVASLLLLSSGATILQIAGNAVVTAPAVSPALVSRFTLLQAFNSLGTVLGPLIAAWFLLGHQASVVVPAIPFLTAGAGLLALAYGFWRARGVAHEAAPSKNSLSFVGRVAGLMKRGPMRGGIVAIFAYVGAEVTIATLAVSYLMLPTTLDASPVTAGHLVSLYWAGAMVGRFAGSYILRRVPKAWVLAIAACAALLLLGISTELAGSLGAAAILAIGLFHSVMFPVAYALALSEDGADAALAAMLLCMAVVGGAIIPFLTGYVADARGLMASFAIPGLCYLIILAFALYRLPRDGELS